MNGCGESRLPNKLATRRANPITANIGVRLAIRCIVEAVVAFCDCPEDVTGQVAVSLEVIADWCLTVHRLDGLARV